MSSRELANDYIESVAKKYAPKTKIVPKQSSKLMKFLNFFVRIFNKSFMTGYVTTIGSTIYVPDGFFDRDPAWSLRTIAHEVIHVRQKKRYPFFLYELFYGFPQILFPVAFICLWLSFGFWWSLPSLILLAPLPAYGRLKLEIQAYRTNYIFLKYSFGWKDEEIFAFNSEHVGKQMTGSGYYFTWPFTKHVEKLINDTSFLNDPVDDMYSEILQFLYDRDLVII